jgi:hypothetical protein
MWTEVGWKPFQSPRNRWVDEEHDDDTKMKFEKKKKVKV